MLGGFGAGGQRHLTAAHGGSDAEMVAPLDSAAETEASAELGVWINQDEGVDADSFVRWVPDDDMSRQFNRDNIKSLLNKIATDDKCMTVIGFQEFPYTAGSTLKWNDREVEREYWVRVDGVDKRLGGDDNLVIFHVHYAGKWHPVQAKRDRSVIQQVNMRHTTKRVEKAFHKKCEDLDKWREAFGTAVPDIPKEGWEWKLRPDVSPGLHIVLTVAERCTTYVRSIALGGGQPDAEGQPRGKVDWAGLRVAGLCIGVGEYKHLGALNNAVRDAEQVNARLNTVPSCRSDIVKDPKTKIELKTKIRKRLKEPRLQEKPPELFCLYYAGHAFEHGTNVYLVPTDARLEHVVDDCDDECLSLDSLMQLLREKLDNPTRLKIGQDRAIVFVIVLDSCRNAAAGRSIGRDQACQVPPDSAPLKYTVFFSCSRTTTASDGPSGGHSPFARALLDAEGGFFAQGVTLRDAISNVSRAVQQGTQQIPIEVRITAIPQDFCIWPKPVAQPGPSCAAGSVGAEAPAAAVVGSVDTPTFQYEIIAFLRKRCLDRIAERLSEELSLEETDDLQYVKEERLNKLDWLEDVPRAKLLKLCREVTARLMSADNSDSASVVSQSSTLRAHSEGSPCDTDFESDSEDVLIAARNGGVCADFQVHMQSFIKSWRWHLETDSAQESSVLGDFLATSWTACMFLWIRFAHDATLEQRLRDKWLHATTNSPNQDQLLSILTECLESPGTSHPHWSPAESCACRKEHAAGISFTDAMVEHALRGNENAKQKWRKNVVQDWFHTDEPSSAFLSRANTFLRDPEHSIKGTSIFESLVETQSYVVFLKMSGLAASLLFGFLEARKLDFASAAGAAGGGRTLLNGFTSFVSSEGHAFSLSKTGVPASNVIVQGLQCLVHLAHACWEAMGPVKTAQEFLLQDDGIIELGALVALSLQKTVDVPLEEGSDDNGSAAELHDKNRKEVKNIYHHDVSRAVIPLQYQTTAATVLTTREGSMEGDAANVTSTKETPKIDEPEWLCCPIAHVMFRDPVMVPASGTTYEFSTLEKWWTGKKPKDLFSNEELWSTKVITNMDKRREVNSWLQTHPDYVPSGWDSRDIPPPPKPPRYVTQEAQAGAARLHADRDDVSPHAGQDVETWWGEKSDPKKEFNADWVRSLHEEIQEEVQREGNGKDTGIHACMWERILEKWQKHIRDVPYERVQVACVKQILQHARLTSPSASPMFYETLRRLGKDVLVMQEQVDESLLEKLLPSSKDTKWYEGFFGERERWTIEYLAHHLKTLHGSSSLKIDKRHEKQLGFIVAHVRSNRYNAVEMQAILKHLIKDIDKGLVDRWTQYSTALNEGSEQRGEAQSFILRCVEALHREQQSLEGTLRRGAAAGVLLFADVWTCTGAPQIPMTDLDMWLQQWLLQGPSFKLSMEKIGQIIEDEHRIWKQWKQSFERKRPDIHVKNNNLFEMMRVNLSSPGLIPNVLMAMKTYGEKKALIREAALQTSLLAVVKNIIVLDLSQQEQLKTPAPASTVETARSRQIAVFGYCRDINGYCVAEESDSESVHQSVIVRTVPLTRKQEGSGSVGEMIDISDYRLFELGVNIKGTYIALTEKLQPKNFLDLSDMLKNGGLRLHKADNLTFFQFVSPGVHCPRSKPVEDILSSTEDGDPFTHVLLTVETGGSSRNAQSDIADAGGRFLIDMKRVGSVITEGMRYQALAVEPTASVSTSDDGKFSNTPFRRLAVLMPPSMNEHCNLSRDMERGDGFSESAEIIAEVLSLELIDLTNLDPKKYEKIIHENLQGNPLLMYCTSMELLDTVNPKFAKIVAEYWNEKLCFTGNGFSHLSTHEQEAREMILSLITVHRSSSSSRNNAGERVALASEAHLTELPGLISTQTPFAQEAIWVEETNFESTLQRLKRASPTLLTFVFVYIAGRISADQMSQIVTVPVRAIKLIFRYSSSIVDLLELLPTISDLVYKPETIRKELSRKLRPVPYSSKSAVGCVVESTMSKLSMEPSLISSSRDEAENPAGFWDGIGPEQAVEEALQWQLNVQKWLQEKDQGESAFVRILVTTDDKMTVNALSSFLPDLRVVDAGDLSELFYDLPEVLPPRAIFVLSRASFLPHSQLEMVVSSCMKRGTKLLLLVAEATTRISRFRVFKDHQVPPLWIRVPILRQRLLGGVSGLDAVTFSGRTDRAMLAFVGLQLILSPEAVVSEDHHLKVRFFLDNTNNAKVLEFLDQHDSLDSNTRSTMLLALADRGLDDKVGRATGCRLAVVLATHVNRYVRFRRDPFSSLVSFLDFCRQPTVRFLSQIHRLEAYMWFLFHRTKDDKRFMSDAREPYGFPLGRCLSELTEQHNIHHASNPGRLLMCPLTDLEDLALKDVSVKIALPVPHYVDPGKGDVVTQMQEIVENRALASSELHWEEMYERWQSGPELTDDVLEHILVNSACRISVLLSMTPAKIFHLNLSHEAIYAVSHDFNACAHLLRSMSVAEFPVLRTRTAAIWWRLLQASGSVKIIDDKVFCEEQGLLLDAGIDIEPRALHSEKERVELLGRVTKVIIQSDMENTLTSQHEVLFFLLSDERRDTISEILDDPQVRFGNAFINAIVARNILNQIRGSTCGRVVFERLGDVLQWVKESKGADSNRMSKQMEKLASRITEKAIVTLLMAANPPSDFEKARDGILMPCIRAKHDEDEQRSFLDAVLEPLCSAKPEMAVEVLEVLANSEEFVKKIPEPRFNNLPAFWSSMFKALKSRESCDFSEKFFSQVHDYITNSKQDFALPFESSQTLCSMYVDSFKFENKSIDLKDLDRHEVLLKSELSRTAVFNHLCRLTERQTELQKNERLLVLLYYTWWAEPGKSIPLQMMPKANTWNLFKNIRRRLKLDEKTVSKGMSILARFATAPHTLPASILSTLQKTIVGGDDPVKTKSYVLAQMDNRDWPAYVFRTHTRTLPPECKERLIKDCTGPRDFASKNLALLFFPLTDCGMSKKTVSHNLNILVNILQIQENSRAQLFLAVWTWFEAAGFTMQDLKQMCVSEEEKKSIIRNLHDMKAVYEKKEFAQKMVYRPLPVYVDVRFCSGKDVELFQISQESVAVTMQWLYMLTMQYECCLDANDQSYSKNFYDYTEDRINLRPYDASLPSTIVTQIFNDIAKYLIKKHMKLEPLASAEQSACEAVVDDVVPIVDFFGQLRVSGFGDFGKYSMVGLSTGLQSSSPALQVCVADALYMLLGVTPANKGLEVLCMLEMWRDKELALGSSIQRQMKWMATNVWVPCGLEESATKLTQMLENKDRPIKIVDYVRNTTTIPLAEASLKIHHTSFKDTYAFTQGIQPIFFPDLDSIDLIDQVNITDEVGGSSAVSQNLHRSPHDRRAEYDHVGQRQSTDDIVEEHKDFFTAAPKVYGKSSQKWQRSASIASTNKPRKISARDLIQIDAHGGGGYAVVRIVPGLHPVLRSPSDSGTVLQQKSLGRDSIEKSSGFTHSKIDRFFSNNGAAWEHLSQLPAGSTLIGNGFYLRKSLDGGWILLLGASTQEVLDHPPYHLWSVLDTFRLAALDFDEKVLEVFKGIVGLAFETDQTHFSVDRTEDKFLFTCEAKFLKTLQKLRRSSVIASHGGENLDWYLKYLQRESTICLHILDVLNSIRHTNGKDENTTVLSTFNLCNLENKLSLPVRSIYHWASRMCNYLGLLVGIRDCVPRSQLIFTLELVLRNSKSIIQKLEKEIVRVKGPAAPGAENPSIESDDGDDNTGPEEVPNDLSDDDERQMSEWTFAGWWEQAGASSNKIVLEKDIANRLIAAPHEHITQRNFNQAAVAILKNMTKRKSFKNKVEWIKLFEESGSEDEDKNAGDTKRKLRQRRRAGDENDEDDQVVKEAKDARSLFGSATHKRDEFDDDELDVPLKTACETEHEALFPSTWGYGPPVFSSFCATSIMSEHRIPLYHFPIKVRGLKIAYSDSEGLPVAFLFHKRILQRSLKSFVPEPGFSVFFDDKVAGQEPVDDEAQGKLSEKEVEEKMKAAWSDLSLDEKTDYAQREKEANIKSRRGNYRMLAYREELLKWLVDLVRSPLPTAAIHWFLSILENGATTLSVPSLSSSVAANDHALNLLVIAHCIAKALPPPNEAKGLFSSAFDIPPSFMKFTNRKNDIYGIHIVRKGTLKELQDHGAVVEVCNLGYDALTRSKDTASMYLSIIKLFSKFIWLVYVIGLDTIDDALLKWLGEYTRAHPWRFVYLENTQTSWNFSENRDRCVYDHAPPPVERGIKCEEDLDRPAVKHLRPTHLQPYPRIYSHCKAMNKKDFEIMYMDWSQLSEFTSSFFSHSSIKSAPSRTADHTTSNWSRFFRSGKDEYQLVREIMEHSDPCVLLLCSPPGAGKSHFSNELAELIKSKIGLRRVFIDGSDDRLVDMTLAEILNVELPDPSRAQLLVVDEFHMLNEHHKFELFEWLKSTARRLHVLFIANRKDARDDELLEDLRHSNMGILQGRIASFSIRLGITLLNEVMDKRHTKGKGNILRWMHCSRCLFGGEAVSLRDIAKLEESLQGLQAYQNSASNKALVDLLLNKVPTISEATAQEFVTCFCASLRGRDTVEAISLVAQAVKSPVSLMMQASLLTESIDALGTDYPDFVCGLDRAYDASPSLRISAWCCQMQDAARDQIAGGEVDKMIEKMDLPKPIFSSAFVDQCGFPLQLEESSQTGLSQGLAFSWGGDYTRLLNIIDAVKHGHLVDWKDVHERCWKREPVRDSSLLVELLSVCSSPAKVLSALTKENLCSLLKKSKPSDALNIARDVLKYRTHKATASDDKFNSPYRVALWMTILYDYKALIEPQDLLKLMGFDAMPDPASAELDPRESELADALSWASTHMMDMKIVCADDDPKRRLKFLIDTLVYLSNWLIDTDKISKKSAKVAHLWDGMFAPLLSCNEKRILVHVAMSGEDCHSKWHEPLPSLWRIAHGRGSAAEVEKIWNLYKDLLFEESIAQGGKGGQGHRGRGRLIPGLAGGILCVLGVIPYNLQITLLTSNCDVDMTLIEGKTDDCERAMNLISSALETLVKNDASKIVIPEGTFKRLVDNEIDKIKRNSTRL